MTRNDFETVVKKYGCECRDGYVYKNEEKIGEYTDFWFQYRSKTIFYKDISGQPSNVGVLYTHKFKDVDFNTFNILAKDYLGE